MNNDEAQELFLDHNPVTREDSDEEVPPEFLHLTRVLKEGAKKHGAFSWLDPDNKSIEHRANHASMFRHLAESSVDPNHKDSETGLDPLLHLACRALMAYTRKQRGL